MDLLPVLACHYLWVQQPDSVTESSPHMKFSHKAAWGAQIHACVLKQLASSW
jgi:hypothetical protein